MNIEYTPKLDFEDVLFKPKRSELGSRKEVDLVREFTFRNSGERYVGVPIIAANMDTIATFEMADSLREYKLATALHKHYTIDELVAYFEKIESEHVKLVRRSDGRDTVFYSMGILDSDQEKLSAFLDKKFSFDLDYLCVDVANGYSERFNTVISQLRDRYPDTTIMAGNVVTGEMTEQLLLSGADIVKVGIGPGSVCTTRKMTGVGYPQLSAIMECADSAHGLGGHICADGGCQVPGDVAKAFGAGADFVMLGGMLAGHTECGGEVHEMEDTKQQYMKFYGMSSKTAMDKHAGGVAEYRASEGKEVYVPYKGPVEDTIREILGGVRSCCTYIGARRLKNMSKCTTFVLTGRQLNNKFG
jgi:GMP reductase